MTFSGEKGKGQIISWWCPYMSVPTFTDIYHNLEGEKKGKIYQLTSVLTFRDIINTASCVMTSRYSREVYMSANY